MRLLKEHAVFVVIFVLCAVLRFIPLLDYQFTFDELSGLDRTQFMSTGEVIEKGVKVDAHPALVQLIIYWLSRTFGYVTWIIKLPFIVCSLGAVFYAYLFGFRFLNKQSGIFAAGIFAFSLVFVFYAPIARMYITGVFFSLGLLFHFYKIFFSDQTRLSDYFGLGIFALLSALNQHVNSLFAMTVCASGCFFLTKQNWKPYLITCVVAVGLYLPHLPVTLYQLSVPGIGRDAGGWLDVPDWWVVISFIKILFGTGYVYLLFACIVVAAIILKGVSVKRSIYLLPVLFLSNYLIVYFYSIYKSPIYQHSMMLFAGTGLVLFISAFLRFENKTIYYLAFSATMVFLLVQTYGVKDYFSQSVKTVYEYQFERTADYEKKRGRGSIAAIFFDCDTLMRKIFYNKHHCEFKLKISSDSIVSYGERKIFDSGNSSIHLFSAYVRDLKTGYLALSSSTPLYEKIVMNYYPYLIENTQTQAVYYKVFSKLKPPQEAETDKLEELPGAFKQPLNGPMRVDSTIEFPFGVKCRVQDLKVNPGAILFVETFVNQLNKDADELESVISLTDSTDKTVSYGARQLSDFLPGADSITGLYSEHFLGTAFEKNRRHATLNSYLWNKAHGRFNIINQRYYLIDYWHNKWNFWE